VTAMTTPACCPAAAITARLAQDGKPPAHRHRAPCRHTHRVLRRQRLPPAPLGRLSTWYTNKISYTGRWCRQVPWSPPLVQMSMGVAGHLHTWENNEADGSWRACVSRAQTP
jgi:hypothetical protein